MSVTKTSLSAPWVLLALTPMLGVGCLWVQSLSPYVLELYDADRNELWMLHDGAIHLMQDHSREPAPKRRFDLDFVEDDKPFGAEYRLSLLYPAIVAALIAAWPLLQPLLKRRRRRVRETRGLCPGCAYNLSGNKTGRCPECGESCNLTHPSVGTPGRVWRITRRGMLLLCSILGLAALVVGITGFWRPIQYHVGQAPSIVLFESSHGRLGLWHFGLDPPQRRTPIRVHWECAGFHVVCLPQATTQSAPPQAVDLKYVIIPFWFMPAALLVWPLSTLSLYLFRQRRSGGSAPASRRNTKPD